MSVLNTATAGPFNEKSIPTIIIYIFSIGKYMQNNKKLVEKYTKLISDSDKMRIDKDKASENQGIGKNLTKERSNTSSLIKIGQSPSQNPSILNHSPSPSSYGSIKQTMLNNQNALNPTSVSNKEKIKVAFPSRTPKILTPEQQAKYDAAEAAAVKENGGRGRAIFKNPNLPEDRPKYNSDQSGDSDGETKITQNNKKLVEKYIKLISEEGGGFLETLGVPSWLDPTTLIKRATDKLGWTGTPTTKSPNGGGGFDGGAGNQSSGNQSSGNFGVGGGSQSGGGGSREDRKRKMRDDQSVTDYGKMLNRASGIRDARLAKIDASRTPAAVAERKKARIAKSDAEDVAMGITPDMTPAQIQEKRKAKREADSKARIDSNARLSQDALDMIKANKEERDSINKDPATIKLRADAEARTAARANADRGGTDQRGAASGEFTMRGGKVVRSSDEHYDNVQNANATGEWIDPNSPGGRVIGQERRAAVDDQRDQFGPKNIETARADAKKDTARVKAELEAERTADDIAIADRDNKNRRDTGAIPYLTPQDKRPVYPPLGASDKEDGNGVPLLLARPQPEPKYPNPLVRKPNGSPGPVSPSAPGMTPGRQDKPDYGVPPGIARPSGIPSLIARPDPNERESVLGVPPGIARPSGIPSLIARPDPNERESVLGVPPGIARPYGQPSGIPPLIARPDPNVASLLRPKTSPKTSGPQDKPDYGVPPGIARPSGIPSLIARPQPEPPDNTPIDAQGQQNLQNIKRAFNPNTRPSPNERPSPNAGDKPFLRKPSSGLTRLANIPIQVKPGDRRRISASQLAREAQSRRA
jgi:hypothetical protein